MQSSQCVVPHCTRHFLHLHVCTHLKLPVINVTLAVSEKWAAAGLVSHTPAGSEDDPITGR